MLVAAVSKLSSEKLNFHPTPTLKPICQCMIPLLLLMLSMLNKKNESDQTVVVVVVDESERFFGEERRTGRARKVRVCERVYGIKIAIPM
jgi:hypothetical protein